MYLMYLILLLILLIILLCIYLKKEIEFLIKLLILLFLSKYHSIKYGGKNYSYADVVEEKVDLDSNRIVLICADDDKHISMGEIESKANQIAHWGQSIGCKQRDTIAIMMLNKPELIEFWIGLAKIGVTTAMINTNSIGTALIHCVDIATKDSGVKLLVIDNELRDNISKDISKLLSIGVQVLFWDDISDKISMMPNIRPDRSLRNKIIERDPLMFIFTSGTTGLPKAGKISHSRYFLGSIPFGTLCSLNKNHRIYNSLPLYHAAAGMIGIGTAIRYGPSMVIRKKFSVRNFIPDCVRYKCTCVQYIGELARYCLTAPSNELESQLNIQYAFGNGLRADIWEKFQKRFNIKHIVEFYAATEGNIALFNGCDKVGALGFIPRLFDFIYPVRLVKVDPNNKNEPLRDEKGYCILCDTNEKGLMIAAIDNSRVDRRFDGYTDSTATKSKILHNVFFKGDTYFNTGDLLYRDYVGFFYWSDRLGDTFRWKGENVATTEVANTLSAGEAIEDVTIYGVSIPGCEGKAGMAAITLTQNTDINKFPWNSLHYQMTANLPPYARPIFFRFQKVIPITSTFKHKKDDLVKEGFDPSAVGDDVLYFFNSSQNDYQLLTESIYRNIIEGKIRF